MFQASLEVPKLSPDAVPTINLNTEESPAPEITHTLMCDDDSEYGKVVKKLKASKKATPKVILNDVYKFMKNMLPSTWNIIFPIDVQDRIVFSNFTAKINTHDQFTLVPLKEILLRNDGTLAYNCCGIAKQCNTHMPSKFTTLENLNQIIEYFNKVKVCRGLKVEPDSDGNMIKDNQDNYHSYQCPITLKDEDISVFCNQITDS